MCYLVITPRGFSILVLQACACAYSTSLALWPPRVCVLTYVHPRPTGPERRRQRRGHGGRHVTPAYSGPCMLHVARAGERLSVCS